MQLYIDNRSGAPIYDQIYSQIKDAILSGQVAEGAAQHTGAGQGSAYQRHYHQAGL